MKGDVGDAVDEDRGEEAFCFEAEPAAGDAADEREQARHKVKADLPARDAQGMPDAQEKDFAKMTAGQKFAGRVFVPSMKP